MANQIRKTTLTIQNIGNRYPVNAKTCSFDGEMYAVAMDASNIVAGIKTNRSDIENRSFFTRVI
jgi:hypothetical protein